MRGIAPEPFERIEGARVGTEDVNDEIEVVQQDPSGAIVALDVRRLQPAGGLGLLYRIGDRLDLARIRSRANQKVVRKAVRRPEVEHDHRGSLAILRRDDRPLHLRRKSARRMFSDRRHSAATEAGTYSRCRSMWAATERGTRPSIDSPAPMRRRMSVDD